MCDCEEENLAEDFHTAFDIFMSEWRKKEGMHGGIIIPTLIAETRVEACFYHDCYHHMVGMLAHSLHDGLKILFDDINSSEGEDPAYPTKEE